MTNNSSGFTLIEFSIATFILMIGLLGTLQGINLAMEKNLDTVFRNGAVSLADDVLMQQRGNAFAAVATLPKAAYKRQISGIQKSYSAAVTVATLSTNSKQVSVDVTWKYRQVAKRHSVTSVVTQIQQN
jgi:type IV pilus assembly protein PilV